MHAEHLQRWWIIGFGRIFRVDVVALEARAQRTIFVSRAENERLHTGVNKKHQRVRADAELFGPWPIDTQRDSLPELKGGGGTSFIPFFDALEKKNPPPEIAVYLTDGYGYFPSETPKQSTLWVISPGGLPSHKFPFGETARITERKNAFET